MRKVVIITKKKVFTFDRRKKIFSLKCVTFSKKCLDRKRQFFFTQIKIFFFLWFFLLKFLLRTFLLFFRIGAKNKILNFWKRKENLLKMKLITSLMKSWWRCSNWSRMLATTVCNYNIKNNNNYNTWTRIFFNCFFLSQNSL